jgi:hypothetical protein
MKIGVGGGSGGLHSTGSSQVTPSSHFLSHLPHPYFNRDHSAAIVDFLQQMEQLLPVALVVLVVVVVYSIIAAVHHPIMGYSKNDDVPEPRRFQGNY